MAIELELYVRDEAGVRYRVHDVAFGPPLAALGHRKRLPLGDPRARYRLFVPAPPEPMMRVHDFRRDGDDRGISAETLSRQLHRAGYSPKKHPARENESPAPYLGG